MDAVKNFARSTLAAGITSGATSLSVQAGDGARFPTTPFNATIWNKSDYAAPSDDPDREIVRVTAIATDAFTIARGQEGTAGVAHNTGGKMYGIIRAFTAKDAMDGGGYSGRKDFTGTQTDLPFASIDLSVNGDFVAAVLEYAVVAHDTDPSQNNTAVKTGKLRFAGARSPASASFANTEQAIAGDTLDMEYGESDPANLVVSFSSAAAGTVITLRVSVSSSLTIDDGALLWTIRDYNGHEVTSV